MPQPQHVSAAGSGPAQCTTLLNARAYRTASIVLLLAVTAVVIYSAAVGRWWDALTLGVFVVVGAVFIAVNRWLPSLFGLLFVLAGLINAAGYAFDWWHTPLWFDEAVHAFTSFAVMAAIGWLLLARSGLNAAGRTLWFTLAVTGIGIVLGILWEVFEWAIGIIGTPRDTAIDLIMDTIGALAAGLFCAWAGARSR